MDVGALRPVLNKVLVGCLVNSLDLVAAEDDCLNRPVGMLDVIDFARHRRDDAKVVTSPLESPE